MRLKKNFCTPEFSGWIWVIDSITNSGGHARGHLGSEEVADVGRVGLLLVNTPRSYEPNDFRLIITGPKYAWEMSFGCFFVSAHAREQKKE